MKFLKVGALAGLNLSQPVEALKELAVPSFLKDLKLAEE